MLKELKFEKRKRLSHKKVTLKEVRIKFFPNESVTFTFRDTSIKNITDLSYITFAVDKENNRCYFKGVESKEDGWKLVGYTKSASTVFSKFSTKKFSDETREFLKKASDIEFDLEYDKDYNLYYVEIKEEEPSLDWEK